MGYFTDFLEENFNKTEKPSGLEVYNNSITQTFLNRITVFQNSMSLLFHEPWLFINVNATEVSRTEKLMHYMACIYIVYLL